MHCTDTACGVANQPGDCPTHSPVEVAWDIDADHPRRRLIYQYVAANPGASLREVMRGTGIPNGTCMHHIRKLLHHGLLTERRHGVSCRLFPVHPASGPETEQVLRILLREPEVEAVYRFVRLHPGAPQKRILDAMQRDHGMPRSTTQHRLARLLRHGVIDAKRAGVRHLAYVASEVA